MMVIFYQSTCSQRVVWYSIERLGLTSLVAAYMYRNDKENGQIVHFIGLHACNWYLFQHILKSGQKLWARQCMR